MNPPASSSAAGGAAPGPKRFDAAAQFQRDAAGAIRLGDGTPAASIPAAVLRHLAVALQADLGAETTGVLYKCGFEWGLRDLKRCHAQLLASYGGGTLDPRRMNRRFIFATWWASLAASGWGTARIERLEPGGRISVVLRDAALAGAADEAISTALYAGLIAGGCSFLDREVRQAVRLVRTDDGQIIFLVGPATAAEQATRAVAAGQTRADIEREFFQP
jgi:predicted hydrocarbon binding protein